MLGSSRSWLQLVLISLASLQLSSAYAAAPAPTPAAEVLLFKPWKEQQLIEAQNQLTRVNNQIVLIKTGKDPLEKPGDEAMPFQLARWSTRGDEVALNRLEKDRARLEKSVEFARNLTFDDYVVGYLSQFAQNPQALETLASRLTAEEVSSLLKNLLKQSDASAFAGLRSAP